MQFSQRKLKIKSQKYTTILFTSTHTLVEQTYVNFWELKADIYFNSTTCVPNTGKISKTSQCGNFEQVQ